MLFLSSMLLQYTYRHKITSICIQDATLVGRLTYPAKTYSFPRIRPPFDNYHKQAQPAGAAQTGSVGVRAEPNLANT